MLSLSTLSLTKLSVRFRVGKGTELGAFSITNVSGSSESESEKTSAC